MNNQQLSAYLTRLGLNSAPQPTPEGLAVIQAAHLETVPFENMDIVSGRIPLALDESALFNKIVERRRGGICYELNLLFASALRALGFNVMLRGGRHPKYGDDMDHLFALVSFENERAPYIADVGFAYNFATPLLLEPGMVQNDGRDRYRIDPANEIGGDYLRLLRIPGLSGEADESELYTFGPRHVAPVDCRTRCDWYSTAPESRFTQGPLVCIDAPDGRRTLSANHLVVTRGVTRTVIDITSPEQFERYLREMMPSAI